MIGLPQGNELLVVAGIVALVFGPTMIPRWVRAIKQARQAAKEMGDATKDTEGPHGSS